VYHVLNIPYAEGIWTVFIQQITEAAWVYESINNVLQIKPRLLFLKF
jgi:hypothetical protein